MDQKALAKTTFVAFSAEGTVTVHVGELILISNPKLLHRLIDEGKITPVGEISSYLYHDGVGDFLWVAADEKERRQMIAQGRAPVFTEMEIDLLKEASLDTLHDIYQARRRR